MAQFTIEQYVRFGEATTFLMGNYNARGVLYGQRILPPNSPVLVALVTDALKWQYEGLPATETLDKVGQYLLWLCGPFQLQARNLTPGGTVPPLPPFTPMPNPIEFVVDGTTPIITGASSAVFPQFVGYNIAFDRAYLPQTQINTQPTYFTWNRVTGFFACSPAAAEGELFSINPV